jgi:hypothetical protein
VEHDELTSETPCRAGQDEPGAAVDIGLTVFRRATYVAEAIESVLAQTLASWRLTVYDNGPGGGEVERTVQPYLADGRITYAPSGEELPLAENWTRALGGTGPYVGLLNDDDRWHPSFIEARVRAMDANGECGFAFSPWVLVEADGTVSGKARLQFIEGVVARRALAERLVQSNIVGITTPLIRRSALESVGAFFDGAWHYCDWEMWARLAARFPAYYLDRHDNDFRRHRTANTFASQERPAQLVAMIDHIEALFEREVPGFDARGVARHRNRSRALLNAAGDVFVGGGWKTAWGLYGRALREYPPHLFTHRSLQMISYTVLGRRRSRAIASSVRSLFGRGSGPPHAET